MGLITCTLMGCAPQQYGYQLHNAHNKQASDFALIVHSVNDFAVEIHSINGKSTRGVINTKSNIPTYLELTPGQYMFGVGINKGYGTCGRVDVVFKEPAQLHVEAEAGKVYLLQRRSKFDAAVLCDGFNNNIHVEFYLTELPALPYEDVRSSFVKIDLDALPPIKAQD